MKTTLKIASGLELPLEVASQATAILGIRGSGKTNTAGVMAEELLDIGQQAAIIDPTDAWWGLRSAYPVFIFGGSHGDVPLAEGDAKTVAEFIVAERVPVILSLRHLRKNAQRRFVADFCEELYHLKGQERYRSPLTIFIDEAPLFIPQRVVGEVTRVVGAVEDLIARGRLSGFGVVMVSQRSATLNKDVLTQCDTIITHRLPSPQDKKALGEWIEENATIAEQKEVLSSLAKLKNGEAWIWAPSVDMFRQALIRRRRTFDSSATPKVGEHLVAPKKLHEIDVELLKGKMAKALERKREEDPEELKKRIRALTAELERRASGAGTAGAATKKDLDFARKEAHASGKVEGYGDAVQREVRPLLGALDKHIGLLDAALASVHALAGRIKDTVATYADRPRPAPAAQTNFTKNLGIKVRPAGGDGTGDGVALRSIAHPETGGLAPTEQRVLDGLAWWASIGIATPSKIQVGFTSGYRAGKKVGGRFGNILGALRSRGLIDYVNGNVTLTDAGAKQARAPAEAPSTESLQQMVMERLEPAEVKVLRGIIAAYPKPITKQEAGARADYTVEDRVGGRFGNILGRLRSLGLIDYPSAGNVVALPTLFLE